jgi:hypothetical protein
MPSRRIFQMTNNEFQGDAQGICTVASLQWAKKCLQLGRGLGSFDELGLSVHQMNALMAHWRQHDSNPALQTEGMGLRMVGNDLAVNQFIDVQRLTNSTPPHVCIFWTAGHTMGYRVSTAHGSRECEFFDIEDGLWLANNDMDILATVMANYTNQIQGMRVVRLP